MQLDRFFASVDYIEKNLTNPLYVKQAADVAAYSEYHYSRIFKSLVGESPKNYVRRRRLSVSALTLLETNKGILDIAIESQFESQEAFTRAFKTQFDCAPASFRKSGNLKSVRLAKPFTEELLEHQTQNMSIQPRMEARDKLKVVGVVNEYELDELDVLILWKTFKPFANNIQNRVGSEAFGLYQNYNQIKGKTQFTYACCVEVSDLNNIPVGMEGWEVDQQNYAVFDHKVGVNKIDDTLRYIWGRWLPQSNYEFRLAVDFEVYAKQFDYKNLDNNITEIWIPISSKT